MPMDWGLARDYAARDVSTEEAPVTEAEWLAAADPRPMGGMGGARREVRRLGGVHGTDASFRILVGPVARPSRPFVFVIERRTIVLAHSKELTCDVPCWRSS
jgi:hypothetical protein